MWSSALFGDESCKISFATSNNITSTKERATRLHWYGTAVSTYIDVTAPSSIRNYGLVYRTNIDLCYVAHIGKSRHERLLGGKIVPQFLHQRCCAQFH